MQQTQITEDDEIFIKGKKQKGRIDFKDKNQKIHFNLYDCGVVICTFEVMDQFMQNFHYNFINQDFVHDVLTSEILDLQISVYLAKNNEYSIIVQQPRQLLILNRDFLNQWLKPFTPLYFDKNLRFYDVNKYIENKVNFPFENLLRDTLFIGNKSDVNECCEINQSAIAKQCNLGKNISIKNSIIFSGTSIGDNCVIENSIVFKNVTIDQNVTLQNALQAQNVAQGTQIINENYKNPYLEELFELDQEYSDEESESEFEEQDDQVDFLQEIKNTILHQRNSLIDNIMIEITSLKFAENKSFSDCIMGFMPPILDEILQKENLPPQQLVQHCEKIFMFYSKLFKQNIQGMEEAQVFINQVEKFCQQNNKFTNSFHIFLQIFYKLEILKPEYLIQWYEEQKSSENDQIQKFVSLSKDLIDYLNESSEEESDDDESDDEESND